MPLASIICSGCFMDESIGMEASLDGGIKKEVDLAAHFRLPSFIAWKVKGNFGKDVQDGLYRDICDKFQRSFSCM